MNMEREMTLVRMIRGGFGSRDKSPFLVQNQEAWMNLKRGQEVDFPVDELHLVSGFLEDVFAAQRQTTVSAKKPKRVVKDNRGNIWHDGVLFSGPDFDAEQAAKNLERPESSAAERMAKAFAQTTEPVEVDDTPSSETPSNDEAGEPVVRKRKRLPN